MHTYTPYKHKHKTKNKIYSNTYLSVRRKLFCVFVCLFHLHIANGDSHLYASTWLDQTGVVHSNGDGGGTVDIL